MLTFEKIRPESFMELKDIRKSDRRFVGVTLYYNGTDICGTVKIDMSVNMGQKTQQEFMEIAAKTLKLF